MTQIENDVLFDDITILENALGSNALKVNSINANCDCAGYYSTSNDDELDTQKDTGATAKAY